MTSGGRHAGRSGQKRRRDDERDRDGASRGRRSENDRSRRSHQDDREHDRKVRDRGQRRLHTSRTERDRPHNHRRDVSASDEDDDRRRGRDAYRRGSRTRSPPRQRERRTEPRRERGEMRRRGARDSNSSTSDAEDDVGPGRGRHGRGQPSHHSQMHATSAPRQQHPDVSSADDRWGREAYAPKPSRDSPERGRVRDARNEDARRGAWGSQQPLGSLLAEGRARSARWLPGRGPDGDAHTHTHTHPAACASSTSSPVLVTPHHHVVLYGVERSLSAGHIRSLVEQLLGVRPQRITRPAAAAAQTARQAENADLLVKSAALQALGTAAIPSSSPTVQPTEGYLDDGPVASPQDHTDVGHREAATPGSGSSLVPPSPSRAVANGLYDAAGPGGMVVLGFERRETAQSAAAKLHGAVLNGLQVAASLC